MNQCTECCLFRPHDRKSLAAAAQFRLVLVWNHLCVGSYKTGIKIVPKVDCQPFSFGNLYMPARYQRLV
jgi:hypothetical protein